LVGQIEVDKNVIETMISVDKNEIKFRLAFYKSRQSMY